MPQKGSAPASYSDLLERVATFDTIEGFGAAYSQMKRPHDLPINYDLSMFRSDSTPMWEVRYRLTLFFIYCSAATPPSLT
jgi:hypothetical protein